MKIFVDSGHNYQGADTGAIGNGYREQDITFDIGIRLCDMLRNCGHSVKMSRETKETSLGNTTAQSLKKRCDMANEWGADLFISIHTNAGGGKGTECFVYSKNSSVSKVAEHIQAEITKRLETVSRGVKEGKSLYVLKNTNAPAVLVETAFIDNPCDREKLINKADDFAKAIFTGITGKAEELFEINDIVWELCARGIISDKALWLEKLKQDTNAYWLAQKTIKFLRERSV